MPHHPHLRTVRTSPTPPRSGGCFGELVKKSIYAPVSRVIQDTPSRDSTVPCSPYTTGYDLWCQATTHLSRGRMDSLFSNWSSLFLLWLSPGSSSSENLKNLESLLSNPKGQDVVFPSRFRSLPLMPFPLHPTVVFINKLVIAYDSGRSASERRVTSSFRGPSERRVTASGSPSRQRGFPVVGSFSGSPLATSKVDWGEDVFPFTSVFP